MTQYLLLVLLLLSQLIKSRDVNSSGAGGISRGIDGSNGRGGGRGNFNPSPGAVGAKTAGTRTGISFSER